MIEKSVMLTPISLWDGFDFSQPTKANMLSEIRYDNVIHREYFFSGRPVGNDRVRIFGTYFTPASYCLPRDGSNGWPRLLEPDTGSNDSL